jgi:hypothetical protein
MRARETPARISFAWYRRDEWADWLNEVPDAADWESSYDEWERRARHVMRELRRQGATPRKVVLRLDEFRQWCQRNSRPLDSAARSEFASLGGRAG